MLCSTPDESQYRRPLSLTNRVGGLQQPTQIRRTVVRRDPPGSVSQQVLPVLEADARCAKSMPETVAKVMHTKARKLRPLSCPPPG